MRLDEVLTAPSAFKGIVGDDTDRMNQPPQEVFIRKYELNCDDATKRSERDLEVLRRSDSRVHENFIRFHGQIKEGVFL